MSAIERLFNRTLTVSRMAMSDDGKRTALGEAGEIACHVQQVSTEEAARLALGPSVTHRIWCGPSSDVKVGDTLSGDGETFSVKGVARHNFGGNTHMELTAERDRNAPEPEE